MPVAAFTFGSFGDITTILQLAWTIRQSLSETAGAVVQVRELIADIDSFTRALQQIKSALEDCASVPVALMNAIAHALEHCFKLLTGVKDLIDDFNRRLSGAVGTTVLQKYWAALGWEILGGKRAVDALRARLSEQVEVIQTLLGAANSQNINGILTATATQCQRLDGLEKNIHAVNRNVRVIFSGLSSLCMRLSVTSAAFTFFDTSGAQILPLAVIPASLASLPCHDLEDDDQYVRDSMIQHGTPYSSRSWLYGSEIPGEQWASYTCVLSAVELGRDYTYSGHLEEIHIDVTLTVACFLHRNGHGEAGDTDVVFVSPVFAMREEAGITRISLAPKASSALSAYLRGPLVVDHSEQRSIIYDLFIETGCVPGTTHLS